MAKKKAVRRPATIQITFNDGFFAKKTFKIDVPKKKDLVRVIDDTTSEQYELDAYRKAKAGEMVFSVVRHIQQDPTRPAIYQCEAPTMTPYWVVKKLV